MNMSLTKHISNFLKYRYLLIQLVSRDFKVKYKRSLLGVVWSLLNPLMTMMILTLVFSTLFKSNIPNFPVYFLCGYVMYNYFSESTSLALGSIYSNASLIKKVYFPKYMFPFSKSIFSLVNLCTSFLAVIIVMIATKTGFHPTMLLFFIPVIYIFIFGAGVSLILSTAAVFFRDLAHLYSIFLTALNFLTPIFYPIDILPESIRPIVELNPLTQTIEMFRQLILLNELPSIEQHVMLMSVSVLTLIIGIAVFYRKQDRFIMYI